MPVDRGQVLFVQLQDAGQTATMARWQSFWIDAAVSWESASWDYQQMDWAGITSGSGGDQATLTLPRQLDHRVPTHLTKKRTVLVSVVGSVVEPPPFLGRLRQS